MSGLIGAIFWASGPSIQAFTYETCEMRGPYEGTHPADPNFLATRAMLLAEWSTEISDTKGALHSVIESLLDGQERVSKDRGALDRTSGRKLEIVRVEAWAAEPVMLH